MVELNDDNDKLTTTRTSYLSYEKSYLFIHHIMNTVPGIDLARSTIPAVTSTIPYHSIADYAFSKNGTSSR